MAIILIVDDRPTNRHFLVTLLGYGGHTLLEAADGAEAFEIVRSQRPDLIITDILMPTLDGYEFVRQLRAEPNFANIPVIFYTATYRDREARSLAKAAGVQYVLTKPAEPQVILNMVNAALGHVTTSTKPSEPVTRPIPDPLQVVSTKLTSKMGELDSLGRRLEALVDLVLQVGSEREPERLLEIACNAARMIVGAKYAAIGMLDESGETLKHFVTSGMDSETIARIGSPPTGKGVLGKLLTEGRPLRLSDIRADPDSVGFPPGHPPMRSFLGVPLASPTGLYGRLYLTEKIGASEFSEQDERVAVALGAQVAVAYENAYRYDEIQRHAANLQLEITERRKAEEALKQQDEELRRRNDELARLYRASESLLTGTLVDLPGLAQTIVQTILREFEHSNCSLLLVNKETRELERLAVEGPYAEQVKKAKLSLDAPGLVAKAIHTGQVINVRDVASEPDYVPNWLAARSELVIPLKLGEEVIGALDVQSAEPSAFHADDERLMTIFGERAALSLERTRLYEQTEQRLRNLEALRAIDVAISSSFNLDLILNILLQQVTDQLNVDAADILLFNRNLNVLEYAAGRGFRAPGRGPFQVRLGEGLAGRAAMQRGVTSIPDLTGNEIVLGRGESFVAEKFAAYFAVPLIVKGQVEGLLEIFHRQPLRLQSDWLNFLETLAGQAAIAIESATLFVNLQNSNLELGLAYEATLEGWSKALDLRDKETEDHTQRVTDLTLKLARLVGVGEEHLAHIRRGTLLHDIGKMGVPDNILFKPGPLTEDEWKIMHMHPQFAHDLLAPIVHLAKALEIPYCHHEKWDGTGYPRGLKGEQIPLAARIFAVVDVWDALTSDRPYRPAWTKEKTLEYIKEQSGRHFDPKVVDVFLKSISSNGSTAANATEV